MKTTTSTRRKHSRLREHEIQAYIPDTQAALNPLYEGALELPFLGFDDHVGKKPRAVSAKVARPGRSSVGLGGEEAVAFSV